MSLTVPSWFFTFGIKVKRLLGIELQKAVYSQLVLHFGVKSEEVSGNESLRQKQLHCQEGREDNGDQGT